MIPISVRSVVLISITVNPAGAPLNIITTMHGPNINSARVGYVPRLDAARVN